MQRLRGVELRVACDVRTRFVDAAEVFAPQKGASPAQVKLLTRRLQRVAQVYRDEHDVDVLDLVGAGAAGGLAGGLAAVGASLEEGFELVAEACGLGDKLAEVDLVITGEGGIDATSFDGKVVGGVADYAGSMGVPVLAVGGRLQPDFTPSVPVLSLADRCGVDAAMADPAACIRAELPEVLRRRFTAERKAD